MGQTATSMRDRWSRASSHASRPRCCRTWTPRTHWRAICCETTTTRRTSCRKPTCALDALPVEFREVIVLRELQDLSYKEIAEVAGIPVGTVMSRLARARRRLERALGTRMKEHD